MNREHLIDRAAHGLHRESGCETKKLPHGADAHRHQAQTVLDEVLPQITKPEQLADIPELSLLTTETRPVATIYQWRDGKLFEDTDSEEYEYFPHMVIADEGPLTVVWQP